MSKRIILLVLCGLLFWIAPSSYALNSDLYSFDTSKQQLRFQHLNQQFRCLACQNETLADSNAPLAQDLRFQIYKMVKQNQSDDQITEFLQKRYGDFIMFRPPVNKFTYILWYAPFLMLLIALARLYWLIRQRKRSAPVTYRFSKEDREKIRHLLNQY